MSTTLLEGLNFDLDERDAETAAEEDWDRRHRNASIRVFAGGLILSLLGGVFYTGVVLVKGVDSGVKAAIALENEWLQPEGVRSADLSAGLEQFAELGIRRAFVGGDKADQEPVISPEPDIPNTSFPKSDL